MLNTEKLELLARVIEIVEPVQEPWSLRGKDPAEFRDRIPERFNIQMVYAKANCGTAGCIIGFANGLFGASTDEALTEVLGLTPDQLSELVMPNGYIGYFDPSPQQAADVIRYLIETGKVDWNAGGKYDNYIPRDKKLFSYPVSNDHPAMDYSPLDPERSVVDA